MYWLIHEATSKSDDISGHRGREEHCLLAGWSTGKDLLYIGKKAKIEHLICFIEDYTRNILEFELSLAIEIEKATRGANDNLNTVLQGFNLWFKGTTTVDSQGADSTIK